MTDSTMLTNSNNIDFIIVRQRNDSPTNEIISDLENVNETSPPSVIISDIESLRSSEHQTRINNNNTNSNIVDIPTILPSRASSLPTYEEAVDTNSPPPTYDALFGKVREARNTSSGILGFMMNVFIILIGTSCTVLVGMTVVIPICMVVFGSLYMHQCPVNEYIPVYLLIGGIFGIVKQLLNLSTRVRQREEDRAEERLRQSPTQTLINCFMLGWFIIGSYWIYKEYEPNYDPSKGKYCNKSLYLFAFWLISSVYIFLTFVLVGLCTATLTFATILERQT